MVGGVQMYAPIVASVTNILGNGTLISVDGGDQLLVSIFYGNWLMVKSQKPQPYMSPVNCELI